MRDDPSAEDTDAKVIASMEEKWRDRMRPVRSTPSAGTSSRRPTRRSSSRRPRRGRSSRGKAWTSLGERQVVAVAPQEWVEAVVGAAREEGRVAA